MLDHHHDKPSTSPNSHLAAGTVGAHGAPLILAGATSFLVSDMIVARDRLVRAGFVNQALLLPQYYGAQLMLASTV